MPKAARPRVCENNRVERARIAPPLPPNPNGPIPTISPAALSMQVPELRDLDDRLSTVDKREAKRLEKLRIEKLRDARREVVQSGKPPPFPPFVWPAAALTVSRVFGGCSYHQAQRVSNPGADPTQATAGAGWQLALAVGLPAQRVQQRAWIPALPCRM